MIYPHHWKYVLEYFGVSVAMDQEKNILLTKILGSISSCQDLILFGGEYDHIFLFNVSISRSIRFSLGWQYQWEVHFLHDTRSVTQWERGKQRTDRCEHALSQGFTMTSNPCVGDFILKTIHMWYCLVSIRSAPACHKCLFERITSNNT